MNCQWRVARRPDGNVRAEDFEYREEPIPAPGEGQFLLRTLYFNPAPLMRMYMSGVATAGEKPLAIGDVIHGRSVGEIVESRHPDYPVGEIVQGQTGWQTYAVLSGDPREKIRRVSYRDIPYYRALGTLGMTGLSAYFGFVDCGKPAPGDLVVVSAAAGGVGSHVVQLAKIYGCRVVAIAGGPKKCELARSLGADDVIDYKHGNVGARIAETCPDGLDIYFDNVGGETLAACLDALAMQSRIVLCGSISEYLRERPFTLTNYRNLRKTNSTMRGFFIYNYERDFDRGERQMLCWLREGKLTPAEHIFDGFDRLPEALASLYSGKNQGITICRVRRGPNDTEGLH